MNKLREWSISPFFSSPAFQKRSFNCLFPYFTVSTHYCFPALLLPCFSKTCFKSLFPHFTVCMLYCFPTGCFKIIEEVLRQSVSRPAATKQLYCFLAFQNLQGVFLGLFPHGLFPCVSVSQHHWSVSRPAAAKQLLFKMFKKFSTVYFPTFLFPNIDDLFLDISKYSSTICFPPGRRQATGGVWRALTPPSTPLSTMLVA